MTTRENEKTFVQKRRKGRKWRRTKKPVKEKRGGEEGRRKHPADTQEGGGWIEEARARQRDGGKKGTMRRKIGTYIETDRGSATFMNTYITKKMVAISTRYRDMQPL